MHSWPHPHLPVLTETGLRPQLQDTATGRRFDPVVAGAAHLYVCGITPYDSTHLGHAFTYVAFDTLNRVWRDAGLEVRYVQNVTDVDDPLLERAEQTGVDWRELAADQVQLFRTDMQALRVLPPEHYIGVVESTDLVVSAVERLVAAGAAYRVDQDVYADLGADSRFGSVSNLDPETMSRFFAERGGDPEREGKKDPLDPLLWRGRRAGEPWWDGASLGPGRPGWHIECGALAEHYLGLPVTVEGGGADLIFPHHEMGTSHLRFLHPGDEEPIRGYLHTGLVAYQGTKMSKSLGNLVFVSGLLADGVDVRAIRMVLLAHHYSESWEYTDAELDEAGRRLGRWRAAVDATAATGGAHAQETSPPAAAAQTTPGSAVVQEMREALANNLDTAACLEVVDRAAARGPLAAEVITAIDALLGIELT
ncbi:cysteine--1-D-myo-inosityl 2-amino-2-deoxy-alpha-D-glucopyranoside ligase [Ruania zhangjianzhongii]|uniref:cysteine--1-D-myo-inosityl 2-amino-2-deoxy-alpha-D-glucopyranoside ligase n=1 Tax=Ruania zhangjianzhongii TaxID=2603206 RepID=UPI0011CCC880|nr:cysteine--1-D-myo-inosityl 2-amino-2-deoxy-alpha-D-glucopyranoside ligase [Ruania zhangjianzhongii]